MGIEIVAPVFADRLPNIGAVIDGGGLEITTGDKRAPVGISVNCKIVGWRIVGDVPGQIELDIYKSQDVTEYPPSSADSIVGGNGPSITVASRSGEGSDLTGWDVDLDANSILEFSVLSVSDFTWVRLELFIEAR